MSYILLTIDFLDNTTSEEILAVYGDYKLKGESLGEISINSQGKLKLLKIAPCESSTAKNEKPLDMLGLEEEREGEKTLSINDFTTKIVKLFKVGSIKTEEVEEEEKTEEGTTAIESKTETTEGANETESL